MRKNLLTNCAVAALAASFGTTAWAGASNDSSPARQNAPESASQAQGQGGHARESRGERQRQTPEGYVLIEENTVYLMANEPQQHLLQAHADLARKDYRAAAEETRLAAAHLDMQAARPGDKQNNDLKKEAQQLRKIAGELQNGNNKGNNTSIQTLDKDFARASDALAKHFDAITQHDLSKQNYVAAGYDLNATANAFKDTIIWSDQKPSKDDLEMIGNAQEIALNLRSNEVYKGEKALKAEKQAWNNESAGNGSSQHSQQAQSSNQQGQAQQANARLPAGVTHNPLTGTTPAEARNDAQHAQKMADALGKAIDQFDSKIGQSQGQGQQAGQNKATSENNSSSAHQENAHGTNQPK
jgi:hypothetical protein